jgi:predicted AAA+ superfamily ATPase
MKKQRYLTAQINADLKKKMVFVAGPRQVGKTTLAKQILGSKKGYLNWDIPADRESILKGELPPLNFIVFDEIHKYRSWRNYLKGLYDSIGDSCKILVTGSAKLDYYRFGGDSLQGRYHFLRLHPFSIAELRITSSDDLMDLLQLSGFPEPFLSGSEVEAKRWSREYRQRLVYEEVGNLEKVSDINNIELLSLRLPLLAGSPLSVNSIREDLQVSHKAVSRWLDILERLYSIVRLPPFGAPKIRAVKKEQKHYHYDWSLVPELPLRFENLVAMHLLKWIHFQQDTKGKDMELNYFRDVDGREVDFVITENTNPVDLIEVKWKDTAISKGLKYLKERFPDARAYQISAYGVKDYMTSAGIRVMPAIQFLSDLV